MERVPRIRTPPGRKTGIRPDSGDAGRSSHGQVGRIASANRSTVFRGEGAPSPHPPGGARGTFSTACCPTPNRRGRTGSAGVPPAGPTEDRHSVPGPGAPTIGRCPSDRTPRSKCCSRSSAPTRLRPGFGKAPGSAMTPSTGKRIGTRRRSGPGRRSGFEWSRRWDRVLDWNPPFARWFVGGKLNASVNCLDRHLARGLADRPGDPLGGRARRPEDAQLRRAPPGGLPLRERAAAPRSREGGPGGDLSAHDPRAADRHARLRPDRRPPQRGVRRVLRAVAPRPDQRRRGEGAGHRRRRLPGAGGSFP